METTPWLVIIIHSFAETLILVHLGLALTGVRVTSGKTIILIAFYYALISGIIRTFPLPPGMNVLIQLPLLTILLFLAARVHLWLSCISVTLGFLCVSLTEFLFINLITAITDISIQEAFSHVIYQVLYPIPEFIFLILLIVYLKRREINMLHLPTLDVIQMNRYAKSLLILLLAVLLIVLAFYYQLSMELGHLSVETLLAWVFFVIFTAVILALALSWKMYSAARQENMLEIQQLHINNLQEMMQIIKAQRHDFVNHLQVIYGLLSMDHNDQVKTYIKTLYQDVQATSDVLQLAYPELSALLMVKSSLAAARNATLQIEQKSDLTSLQVPSMELVTVVGNLLNNAIEAVEDLNPELKTIKLKIYERPSFYVIQTHNNGSIPGEIKDSIFFSGVSSKSGERGIGLASVKYQVEKYNGMVLVSSTVEKGTRFTVCYPRRKGA